MNRHRYLAWPTYQVALVLVLIPLVETTLSIMPLKLGETEWRFGTTGLFSRALLTPLLGLVLAFVIAIVLEHRIVQRVIAVFSAFLTVLLTGVLGLFLLDALQLRGNVNPQLRGAFDLAAALAAAKYFAVGFVLVSLCVCAWKASKKEAAVTRSAKKESDKAPALAFRPMPVVVTQEAHSIN